MLNPIQISRVSILCVLYLHHNIMWHSNLNDMEIPGTKRFIPKKTRHFVVGPVTN